MTNLSGPQIVLIGMASVFVVLAFMMLLVVGLRLAFGEKAAPRATSTQEGGGLDSKTSQVVRAGVPEENPLVILTAAVKAYQADEAQGGGVREAEVSPNAWQQAGMVRVMQGKASSRPVRVRR